MYLSDLVSALEGSATAEVFAVAKKLEKQGYKVYHLEIGQPDFPPPKPVLNEICWAAQNGKTTYTPSKGIPELLDAIISYTKDITNTEIDESELISISGAKHGIFSSLFAVLNPGDEVLIPDPCWVSYFTLVKSIRAKPVFLNLDSPEFDLDLEKVKSKISDKTKAIIINSPNNPTGSIYSYDTLKGLIELAMDNDFYVISDEIYWEYSFRKEPHSILEFPEWREKGIIINGFSKTFSMTGLRLGWVIANQSIIDQVNKIVQFTTSCPPSVSQYAGIKAIDNIEIARKTIKEKLPPRIELVEKMINECDKVFLSPIHGAMYAFIKLGDGNIDDKKFTTDLLTEKKIAVTPGSAFGPAGKGHVRISLGVQYETLELALKQFLEFVKSTI